MKQWFPLTSILLYLGWIKIDWTDCISVFIPLLQFLKQTYGYNQGRAGFWPILSPFLRPQCCGSCWGSGQFWGAEWRQQPGVPLGLHSEQVQIAEFRHSWKPLQHWGCSFKLAPAPQLCCSHTTFRLCCSVLLLHWWVLVLCYVQGLQRTHSNAKKAQENDACRCSKSIPNTS